MTTEDLDVIYGDKPDQRESDGDVIITRTFDMDWITARIAVGSAPYRASDVGYMRAMNVTHVLSCENTDTERFYAGTGIVYMHCRTEDDGAPKGAEWFLRGVRFGVDALASSPTARLLVHCAAGVNRSPGMAYAILRARGLAAAKARHAVLTHRRIAQQRYFDDADRFVMEVWR